MNTQYPARSARPRTKRNVLILHHCNACDNKWSNERAQYKCPNCKYTTPRNYKDKFKVIKTIKVNTNDDGRIICHPVEPNKHTSDCDDGSTNNKEV